MLEEITQTLDQINPVPSEKLERAQKHIDQLTKPRGSLGRLEELGRRYTAIKSAVSKQPIKKSIFVFAADHGVAAEGVSAYPSQVTPQMVLNILDGGAAINVLARHVSAEVVVVDIGVNYDFASTPGLLDRKIAYGTTNMMQGPSMTSDQAESALLAGIKIARKWVDKGTDILATGDMGIGNTTPASAIMSLYGQQSVKDITGRGTGINDETLKRKIFVIEEALRINRPDVDDPLDVLAKVGGFEIAGIAGLILGAAAKKTPVVIDGLISGAAAVIALKMNYSARDYMFPSHKSHEPGHDVFFKLLGQAPLLDLGMRLGEGTGAALGINLLEAGARIYSEMASFSKAGVSGPL